MNKQTYTPTHCKKCQSILVFKPKEGLEIPDKSYIKVECVKCGYETESKEVKE